MGVMEQRAAATEKAYKMRAERIEKAKDEVIEQAKLFVESRWEERTRVPLTEAVNKLLHLQRTPVRSAEDEENPSENDD